MERQPRVLVVDDEPFNIDYLEQELEELGYELASAANGRAALERVAAEPPDVILLDIRMPEMDGFQVLQHLQADERHRDIPVIVVAALDDRACIVRGIELGAQDYLSKPFDPVVLKARLLAAIRAHGGEPAQRVCDGLLAEVREFMGDAAQVDDITLVVVARDRAPAGSGLPGRGPSSGERC